MLRRVSTGRRGLSRPSLARGGRFVAAGTVNQEPRPQLSSQSETCIQLKAHGNRRAAGVSDSNTEPRGTRRSCCRGTAAVPSESQPGPPARPSNAGLFSAASERPQNESQNVLRDHPDNFHSGVRADPARAARRAGGPGPRRTGSRAVTGGCPLRGTCSPSHGGRPGGRRILAGRTHTTSFNEFVHKRQPEVLCFGDWAGNCPGFARAPRP